MLELLSMGSAQQRTMDTLDTEKSDTEEFLAGIDCLQYIRDLASAVEDGVEHSDSASNEEDIPSSSVQETEDNNISQHEVEEDVPSPSIQEMEDNNISQHEVEEDIPLPSVQETEDNNISQHEIEGINEEFYLYGCTEEKIAEGNKTKEDVDPEREKLLAILEDDAEPELSVEDMLEKIYDEKMAEENRTVQNAETPPSEEIVPKPSSVISTLLHPNVDALIDMTDDERIITIRVDPAEKVILIDDEPTVTEDQVKTKDHQPETSSRKSLKEKSLEILPLTSTNHGEQNSSLKAGRVIVIDDESPATDNQVVQPETSSRKQSLKGKCQVVPSTSTNHADQNVNIKDENVIIIDDGPPVTEKQIKIKNKQPEASSRKRTKENQFLAAGLVTSTNHAEKSVSIKAENAIVIEDDPPAKVKNEPKVKDRKSLQKQQQHLAAIPSTSADDCTTNKLTNNENEAEEGEVLDDEPPVNSVMRIKHVSTSMVNSSTGDPLVAALGGGGIMQQTFFSNMVAGFEIMAKHFQRLGKHAKKRKHKKKSHKKHSKSTRKSRKRARSSSSSISRSRSRSKSITQKKKSSHFLKKTYHPQSSKLHSRSKSKSPLRGNYRSNKKRSSSKSPISKNRSKSKSPVRINYHSNKTRSSSKSPISKNQSKSKSPLRRNYRSNKKRSSSKSPISKNRSKSKSPMRKNNTRNRSTSNSRSRSPISPTSNTTLVPRVHRSRKSPLSSSRNQRPRRYSSSSSSSRSSFHRSPSSSSSTSTSSPSPKRRRSISPRYKSKSRSPKPIYNHLSKMLSCGSTPKISCGSISSIPSTSQQTIISHQSFQESVRKGNSIMTRKAIVTTSYEEELQNFKHAITEKISKSSEKVNVGAVHELKQEALSEDELDKLKLKVFDSHNRDVTKKRPTGDLNHPFYIHPEDVELYRCKCQNGIQPLQALHEICVKCQWKLPTYLQLPTIKGFKFGMVINGHNFIPEVTRQQKKLARAESARIVLQWMKIIDIGEN